MLDDNFIVNLEKSLDQTRSQQSRLSARLAELEDEAQGLRKEIEQLEQLAIQFEQNIDGLLVTMQGGSRRRLASSIRIEDDGEQQRASVPQPVSRPAPVKKRPSFLPALRENHSNSSIAYINQNRGGVPRIREAIEPISHRFSDRTITQSCTLLLREAGKPLHVNELYNLLVAGGMEFKGNNPTISIAVSLHRNRRFRKVEPGTFDLVMREASQVAS